MHKKIYSPGNRVINIEVDEVYVGLLLTHPFVNGIRPNSPLDYKYAGTPVGRRAEISIPYPPDREIGRIPNLETPWPLYAERGAVKLQLLPAEGYRPGDLLQLYGELCGFARRRLGRLGAVLLVGRDAEEGDYAFYFPSCDFSSFVLGDWKVIPFELDLIPYFREGKVCVGEVRAIKPV